MSESKLAALAEGAKGLTLSRSRDQSESIEVKEIESEGYLKI